MRNLGLFLLACFPIHALEFTKDTVFESWTWNDSTSILNTEADTVFIDTLHFKVPQGKEAHLRFGYNDPYRRTGVDGPVIRSTGPFMFSSQSEKRIVPGGRIPITGFSMETCIYCPTGGSSSNTGQKETLLTYLIFVTTSSRDTLVVIGDIENRPPCPPNCGMITHPVLNLEGSQKLQETDKYNTLGRMQKLGRLLNQILFNRSPRIP